MIIDSHVHFWKYNKQDYPWIDSSMKVLRKDYLPDDIELTLKRNHVDGCIAVQATATELETRFLAELANTNAYIKGVIGWADLKAADAAKKLEDLKAYPAIKGIRHVVQDEADDFLYNNDFRNGISLLAGQGFTYDILVYSRQLPAAIGLVADFPNIAFILDHSGKPAIRKKDFTQWRENMLTLASSPNVSCKLSGLLTEAEWKGWSPADFYPYLDTVFEAFGPGRLLFGSDWPVMLLSGIYVQWKSLLEKYMENYTQEEKDDVFGLNAQRVYQL